jgi:succinate-semialdehyde dehydrogenase/glutarate-semialdehyde dehydrogenase
LQTLDEMAVVRINSATSETIRSFEALSMTQIDEKLKLAANVFHRYRHTVITERAQMMIRAAEILVPNRDYL